MNSKATRFKIFKIYADNLDYIVKNSSLKDSYDKGYGVNCPLCMKHFTSADELTLEHFPPYSLGGRNLVLTCKECNNINGHKIDSHLYNALKDLDFFNYKPNSQKRIKIYSEQLGNQHINTEMKVDKDGIVHINFNKDINHPQIIDKFLKTEKIEIKNYLFEGVRTTRKLEFTSPKYRFKHDKKIDLALLKIAYLFLFQKFGHVYLFTKSSEIIRKQLLNPNENIIDGNVLVNYRFPDKNLGINIIVEPKDFKSFLVVFDLKTKSDTYRIPVILPGFSDEDGIIYKKLKIFYSNNNECKVTTNNFINQKMDVNNLDYSFFPIFYWEEYVDKE